MVRRTPQAKKKGNKKCNGCLEGFHLLRGQSLEDLIRDIRDIEKKFK